MSGSTKFGTSFKQPEHYEQDEVDLDLKLNAEDNPFFKHVPKKRNIISNIKDLDPKMNTMLKTRIYNINIINKKSREEPKVSFHASCIRRMLL